MAMDEEYLDSLLRSIQDEEKTIIKDDEPLPNQDETEEMKTPDTPETEESFISDFQPEGTEDEEVPSLTDILGMTEEPGTSEETKEAETDSLNREDDGEWKADLDRLLASANEENASLENEDVTQYIDNMPDADEDLSEISELLKKSDNHEAVESDDDMLALLESLGNVDTGANTDKSDAQESFDIFAEGAEEQNEVADETVKKEKRTFFGRKKEKSGFGRGLSFGKKRSKKQDEAEKNSADTSEQENAENVNFAAESDDLSFDALPFEEDNTQNAEGFLTDAVEGEEIPDWDALIPERDSEKEKGKKNKKRRKKEGTETPGFLKHLSDLLFEEAEEESASGEKTDENGEILKELDQEDKVKAGKKKKEKKKKDKKGKKGKVNENTEGEGDGDDGEETEPLPQKKKKPKKEKKIKEQKPVDKGKKVLSRKALLVLIAFCATLIAAVVSLSLFLPDYADKKNAREAFYAGNYQETYRLFYDKNLNSSDTLIFRRAETVLKLQRKLDAYENNKKLGSEAKALDALLQGTALFEELQHIEQYGAEEELRGIYENMLTALEQDYGINEEEAKEINTYDADTYSEKIYSVVNGTEFVKPGEEKIKEPAVPVDILPEEEDIIDMENAGLSF